MRCALRRLVAAPSTPLGEVLSEACPDEGLHLLGLLVLEVAAVHPDELGVREMIGEPLPCPGGTCRSSLAAINHTGVRTDSRS